MKPLDTLNLDLGEHRVPFHIRREVATRSKHTGRELREVHGWVSTADAKFHEWLCGALKNINTQVVRSSSNGDELRDRWLVSWNSYAESDGVHTHTLILRENEELSIEALVIDGMELHPYGYREEFSDDELTIWAKLVGTRTGVLRLRALLRTRESFSVVRRGIEDKPRQMRFGVAEWSEEEGRIKYRMVLVDAGADLTDHPELVRIEEANKRSALAFYMNFAENLANLLERRGVLPAEEIEAAREAAREQSWQTRREFWRVADVDLL